MTYRGFTEAVPLSLSSMAHMTMPLEEGVLDGLKQVLQHTLLSCVNYARAMHPPHNFTFRDLTTSPIAWEPHLIKKNNTANSTSTSTTTNSSATEGGGGGDSTKNGGSDNNNTHHHTHHNHHHHSHNQHENDIPASLAKMGYQHQYHRTAFVYLKKSTTTDGESSSKAEFLPKDKELQLLQSSEEDWTPESNILGRISLRYATTALMTPGELNGTEQEDDDDDEEDDTPKCVLYKVLVEYRSLPATGNKAAVQAEELSMLSFGGSVDDDVKYGALAALYDTHAKYVLEIYSVRGKKYKFDLMDSTLSDGTVPRLPVRNNNNNNNNNNGVSNNNNKNGTNGAGAGAAGSESQDPFVKSLCVTVTDHIDVPPVTVIKAMPPPVPVVEKKQEEKEEDNDDEKEKEDDNDEEKEEKEGEDASSKSKKSSAETTATTPSPPKKQYALTKIHLTMEGNLRNENDLPPPHAIAEDIQATFLALNHNPPDMATATPSGHTLLLDPKEAGKVYINGRYVTTWGNDPKIGSHFPALFGMDLHSIPYWHGRIFDFDALKRNYAQLWQEILIDAKLVPMNIGGKLLSRFISGKDPVNEDDDDDDDDDEELLEESDEEEMDDDEEEGNAPPRVDTGIDSLESQVMQSTTYDPVGISAKALATKFKMEYGEEGFPCLAHEIDWVKNRLPGRVPVAVPERLISVLRRGGYFDTKRTADEVWFSESRPAAEGMETELVNKTVELLKEAGCADVHANMIVFFSGAGISDAVQKKGLVRFNRAMRQYHVNESFLKMDLSAYGVDSSGSDGEKMMTDDDDAVPANIPQRAHLLGLHISQEHQDGSVLLRYLLKHSNIPKEEEEKKPEEEKEKVEDKEDDGDGEPAEKKRKI